jgi:hypothetical protein
MEGETEQTLFTPCGDSLADVEYGHVVKVAITHDPDPAGLLDDVDRCRVAGSCGDADRRVQPGCHRPEAEPRGGADGSRFDRWLGRRRRTGRCRRGR